MARPAICITGSRSSRGFLRMSYRKCTTIFARTFSHVMSLSLSRLLACTMHQPANWSPCLLLYPHELTCACCKSHLLGWASDHMSPCWNPLWILRRKANLSVAAVQSGCTLPPALLFPISSVSLLSLNCLLFPFKPGSLCLYSCLLKHTFPEICLSFKAWLGVWEVCWAGSRKKWIWWNLYICHCQTFLPNELCR